MSDKERNELRLLAHEIIAILASNGAVASLELLRVQIDKSLAELRKGVR